MESKGADWKPKGYTSVSPYLVADGAQKIIDFAKATFDAKELRRYAAPDGTIFHAEIEIDDSVVMVADSHSNSPARTSLVHVYVRDVDRTFQRALEAGGTAVSEPGTREGDPDKRGSVKDPCGNTWSMSTQLPSR